MGKKKIDKITRIENTMQRKVALCKRKKGLIKKVIELSVLCDLKICMLIKDVANQRVTHFMSHKDLDIVEIFNEPSQREFYSNNSYERVGGNKDEIDSDLQINDNDSFFVALSDDN